MFRRLPRCGFLFILFSLLLTTLNLFYRRENHLKNFLKTKIDSNEVGSLVDNPLYLLNARFYPETKEYQVKDWHDYKFMNYEANRAGPGENGAAVNITEPEEMKINDALREIEGLNVFVSDKISVNRSLPDVRTQKCKLQKYLKQLPRVSVVVIFHNEHPSLIKRTLHSIVNRSPRELLGEIILVNDASTKEELQDSIEDYIDWNFSGKVKLLNMKTRVGLIVARMEGAKKATEEILVFLDSHIEVNVNWLPPLLEPIALNPRACTTPIIDQFNWLTWEYEVHNPTGVRGIFAWDFDYRMTAHKKIHPTLPKPSPIMLGCAFAINRKYFWDLGAYDDQLLIWNAENYELSFKLWLCGGELLECPCSRVAHVFRRHNEFRKLDGVDFVGRNFKRIAEVWMDNWKYYLYKTNETRYVNIDAGDLTRQKAIRSKLNCKPFDYFMYQIAPEITTITPIPEHNDLAYGVISTFLNDTFYCISDFGGKEKFCSLSRSCNKPHNMPHRSQYFHLTAQGIKHDRAEMCFENLLFENLESLRSQKHRWSFNFDTNQIFLEENEKVCIFADITNQDLALTACDQKNMNQKWSFGFVNQSLVTNN